VTCSHAWHWFVSVLHSWPAGQPLVLPSGQSRKLPQLLRMVPHSAPSSAHVVSTGPQVLVVRLQTWGCAAPPSGPGAGEQPPHWVMVPVHGSVTGPHLPVQFAVAASPALASGQRPASL
jgi:hypothetical protein